MEKEGLILKRNRSKAISHILSSALVLGVLASGATVYASEVDREVGSYSVGELTYTTESKYPYFQKEASIKPYSSTVVYKQDGYVRGSLKAEEDGYERDYLLVHKADVEVIDGTEINYKFMQTVKKTNETSHSLESGVRAQGGYKFLAEIEGHIDHTYVSKEIIEYTKGTETSVNVSKPGDYTLYFYAQAKRYNIYADWYGYTIDNKKERKLNRYVGDVFEATTHEYIKPKKNR
ncbi:hypothetical protein KM924_16645 [Brevibacillus parabrevis]|nr:hypothetical protein [Brevibacillus parabrevis]